MASSIKAALAEKIKPLKLLILDVDGVMTDGRIVFSDDGRETKFFDVKDGHGIKLLMRSGVEVAIITARESATVAHRARDLGISLLYQGMKDKSKSLEDIISRRSLTPHEIGYVGDDIVDLPVMRRVGFSAAVADAVKEVKERADYVTARPGGRGAVREVAELILKAQGKWDDILNSYIG